MTKGYVEERDAALMDLNLFKAFCLKYTGQDKADRVTEITFHKLRTAAVSLPAELRLESYHWLMSRGLQSWDDGDLHD